MVEKTGTILVKNQYCASFIFYMPFFSCLKSFTMVSVTEKYGDKVIITEKKGKIYFCFYLMQEMIVIFVVLFSQRRKWIIQRIKLHGLSYIRKKEILLMGQNIYYTTD